MSTEAATQHSTTTLEKRVTELEKELRNLRLVVQGIRQSKKDWQSTIGMSANNPGFEEMVRLGRDIREQEREEYNF